MTKIVYTNKKGDPNKKYLICKRISNKWQVITEYEDIQNAVEARDEIASKELIEGTITDTLFYKIFYKDMIEIKELSNA